LVEKRDEFLAAISLGPDKPLSVVSRKSKGPAVRRQRIKSLIGRGRRRPLWKNVLHQVLREEFLRFRSAGVKINRAFLRDAAIGLIADVPVTVTAEEIEAETNKSVHELITLG